MRSLARTSLIVLLGFTVVLAGCETLQDASTNPDYSKTRRNAGYGAAAGAVVGLLTRGDKLQNALIGAAVGGLAGGAVGNYQDRQERKLREQMAGTGVSVVRQGNNITPDLPRCADILLARRSEHLGHDPSSTSRTRNRPAACAQSPRYPRHGTRSRV